MWDLPRPGLEPVSPALAGGFLTTAPPGKPGGIIFKSHYFQTSVFELKNPFAFSLLKVHLNCLLLVHRLAEEARTNACENKCGVIKKEHVLAAAKVRSEFLFLSTVALKHHLVRHLCLV